MRLWVFTRDRLGSHIFAKDSDEGSRILRMYQQPHISLRGERRVDWQTVRRPRRFFPWRLTADNQAPAASFVLEFLQAFCGKRYDCGQHWSVRNEQRRAPATVSTAEAHKLFIFPHNREQFPSDDLLRIWLLNGLRTRTNAI